MATSEYNPDAVMDAFQREDYEFVLWVALSQATAGNPAAQCMISMLYQCGYGIEGDLTNAEEWLLRAAAQNDVLACNNLGTLYAVGGEGLLQGPEKSWQCYTRAKGIGFDCPEPYPPGASETVQKLT